MTSVVLPLPGNTALAEGLARMLHAELGQICVRRFPDGETFVQIESPVEGKRVVIACTLDRPDDKILPLLFAADAARDLGASQVGLVAPYLGYMRQDKRFHPGEAITSHSFARLLSRGLDFLVTVDPHLHRYRSLDEIYAIQTRAIHGAPAIAEWIKTQVSSPVLIGPDSESEQWVADVARNAGAPYTVLEKIRRGDRDVEVSVPDAGRWKDHTPVLVDDIISTARTMIQTVVHLKQADLAAPVCIGVHAVLAQTAYEDLMAAGAAKVVTCNTVRHASNQIDLVPLIAHTTENLLLSEPALLRRSLS
jgi:ribose-phosphate pyrophosphokinase